MSEILYKVPETWPAQAHADITKYSDMYAQSVSDPEGFVLDDAYGPLRDGEIERAKQWGAQLVEASASRW